MRIILLVCGLSAVLAFERKPESVLSKQFFENVKSFEIGTSKRIDNDGSFGTRRKLTQAGAHPDHDATATYEISGYNRSFVLQLNRNDNLIHPEYKETRVSADGTHTTTHGRENCFFHGTVEGEEFSTVAMSTCGHEGRAGMHGMIVIGDEQYQIMPAHTHFEVPEFDERADVPHMMYRKQDIDLAEYKTGWIDYLGRTKDNTTISPKLTMPAEERRRLAATKKVHYIEWALVNDNLMHEWYGMDCETHTAALVNQVAANYAEKSAAFVGHSIVVALKHQLTFEDQAQFHEAFSPSTNEVVLLDAVTAFRTASFSDNDNVHLLHGTDMDGPTVGFAGVGVMCTEHSTGWDQWIGNDMGTATVMTHELGHNLQMNHDTGVPSHMTDGTDYTAKECPESCNVLQAIINQGLCGTRVETFSPCSKNMIEFYLDNNPLSCLDNAVR
jgi:hypothetical protein